MLKEFLGALKSVTGDDYAHLEVPLRSHLSSVSGMKEAHVERLIEYFGDGVLRDRSDCSREFRLYLRQAQPVDLARHAKRLVSIRDTEGGGNGLNGLKDVVNEVAHRLGFGVRNGDYGGNSAGVSYGGLWRGDSFDVMSEFVFSETVVDVEKLVSDCDECCRRGLLGEESHIVLIVGRESTRILEDQVRGSRHSWRIRIVGVEALVRMMALCSLTDDAGVGSLVRSILSPEDYMRVDRLVDFVGAMRGAKLPKEKKVLKPLKSGVQERVREVDFHAGGGKNLKAGEVVSKTKEKVVVDKKSDLVSTGATRRKRSEMEKEHSREKRRELRDRMASYVEKELKCELSERAQARCADEKRGVSVSLLMSNRYDPTKGKDYFYNISRKKHLAPIDAAKRGYMFLSFGDRDDALLIPSKDFGEILKSVLFNEKLGAYLLDLKEQEGHFYVKFPKKTGREMQDLEAYRVSLGKAS